MMMNVCVGSMLLHEAPGASETPVVEIDSKKLETRYGDGQHRSPVWVVGYYGSRNPWLVQQVVVEALDLEWSVGGGQRISYKSVLQEYSSMMFIQGMREIHETRKREAVQRLEMAQEWRRSRVKGVSIITRRNSVLHVWSVRAFYLAWASVLYAHTDSVQLSLSGASGAQFLMATHAASNLLRQLPDLPHQTPI
ncbi:hypothetical protein BDR06DRAFT_977685 [Suillus hirtellus]|nr:hypothetical protein BDR06DRAFT_977685 [Suillus hirtellus]